MKEKYLLIHVSTRVHIKTRQTCNSFLSSSFSKGLSKPPLDPPMRHDRFVQSDLQQIDQTFRLNEINHNDLFELFI